MGNCFHPKTDAIAPLNRSENARGMAYAASIPLSSSEYISCLAGEASHCCMSQDNFVSVISNFALKAHFDAAVGMVKCVCFKGESVFAGGKVIRQMSSDGQRQGELVGHELPVTTVDGCPKAELLASGSRDYTVRIWDIPTQKQASMAKINWNVVTCVKWLPERQLLVQCSEDLQLRLWDIRERPIRPAMSLTVGNNFATRCDVSEDYILTAHRGFNAEGCEAKMWDIRQEKHLVTFSGHKQSVEGAVFCAGKIFTCAQDGGIRRFGLDGSLEESWHHPSRHPFLHMIPYRNGLLAATSPAVLHFFEPVEPLTHAMGTM